MSTENSASRVSRGKLGIFGVLALCIAAGIVVTGIMARARSETDLKTWTEAQAIPTVAVALPDAKLLNSTIDLPGRLEA